MLRDVRHVEHDGDVTVQRREEGAKSSVLVVVRLSQPQAVQARHQPLALARAHLVRLRLGRVARNQPLLDDDVRLLWSLLRFVVFCAKTQLNFKTSPLAIANK